MDLRKLKTLIDLVESSGIAELEISEGEERVRITRSPSSMMQQVYAAPQQHDGGSGTPTRSSSSRTRQGRRAGRTCGEVAHGRQLLPLPVPRCQVLRGSGAKRERGRYPVHHRGDETIE